MIATLLLGGGFFSVGVTALLCPPTLIGFAVIGMLWCYDSQKH